MRKVIAVIEIDEDMAIENDMGTIDFLEQEFGWLGESGIYLENARIIDEDDVYDKEAIKLVNEIF